MALGAIEALKARNLTDKVTVIGFDALPEALAAVRDGALTATDRAVPRRPEPRRGAGAGRRSCAKARSREQLVLLTPIAITKDNLDEAERIGEVQVAPSRWRRAAARRRPSSTRTRALSPR